MGIVTIARFLIGDRKAILDIAASRHAIWLGLLFVLSAGFAREYDGEDLLQEPWHLLLPLAASLVTSTILFFVLWIVLHGWRTLPNEWRTFQTFVTLYWMTAPLAWLYAIPVERMFSPLGATQANFWFLGIVAAWRVVLMIRVVSVVFQAPPLRVVFPFMLFADGVLLTLLSIVPTPVLAIMGGVRLSESERMIADITFLATILGTLSLPLWVVGSLIALCIPRKAERVASFSSLPEQPINASLWGLAAASLLIWVAVLPFTQPEQQRRWEVERRMQAGDIAAAIEFMSQHEQQDFPPHWDPPPQLGERRGMVQPRVTLPLIDIVATIDQKRDVAPWVREVYVRKFEDHFETEYVAAYFWDRLSDEDFDRYLDWLERHPLSAETRESQRYVIDESETKRTPEQRERWRKVLQIESSNVVNKSPANPPMPDAVPETPLTGASADVGIAADKPADKEADR